MADYQQPAPSMISSVPPRTGGTLVRDKVTTIHWGKVAKGVAIVAGVVLVAVVAAAAVGFAIQAAAGTAIGGNLLTGLVGAVGTTLQTTGAVLHFLGATTLHFATHLLGALGIHMPAFAAASPHVVAQAKGFTDVVVGGSALTLGAAKVAQMHVLPHPDELITQSTQTHFVPDHHSLSPDNGLDSNSATMQASSKIVKVGAHAAEDAGDYRHERHVQMMYRNAAPSQSWADYVGGPGAGKATIQPRAESFTQQTQADALTAQLAQNQKN